MVRADAGQQRTLLAAALGRSDQVSGHERPGGFSDTHRQAQRGTLERGIMWRPGMRLRCALAALDLVGGEPASRRALGRTGRGA